MRARTPEPISSISSLTMKADLRQASSPSLEVRRPRAVTGGPIARSPARGPGRAGRKYSGCGRARAARKKTSRATGARG